MVQGNRGPDAAHAQCPADVVGVDPAAGNAAVASRVAPRRRAVGLRFFAPFRAYFARTFGRPSIPVETYLRLMFLKVRYRLGYEALCAEVNDSIGWRLFCRIGTDERVPHPTTR